MFGLNSNDGTVERYSRITYTKSGTLLNICDIGKSTGAVPAGWLGEIDVNIGRIKGLSWSVSSVGYVELCWLSEDGDHHPIVVISGNGSWEFNDPNRDLICPEDEKFDGRIGVRCFGFGSLDAYTVLISGSKVAK